MGTITSTVPKHCVKCCHGTREGSDVQKEGESSRDLSEWPVMYGSADPLRSSSSMISILINMCFISPLKYTNSMNAVSLDHGQMLNVQRNTTDQYFSGSSMLKPS